MTVKYPVAVVAHFVGAGVEFLVLHRLLALASRGIGTRSLPYGRRGPPEEKFISFTYLTIQMCWHLMKACDLMDRENSIIPYSDMWYCDYLIAAPLVLVDMAYTLDMPLKLPVWVLTFAMIMLGVASFTVAPGTAMWILCGVSVLANIKLFQLVFAQLRVVLNKIPKKATELLWVPMGVYLGFWPLFTVAWLLSWRVGGVIQEEAYHVLHVVFEILCKSVFGYTLMKFRILMEDTGTFYWYTRKIWKVEKTSSAAGASAGSAGVGVPPSTLERGHMGDTPMEGRYQRTGSDISIASGRSRDSL